MRDPLAWTFTRQCLAREPVASWPVVGRTYAAISTEALCFLAALGLDNAARLAKMGELEADLMAAVADRPDHTIIVWRSSDGAIRLTITDNAGTIAELAGEDRPSCAYRPSEVAAWLSRQERVDATRH